MSSQGNNPDFVEVIYVEMHYGNFHAIKILA
jgi:hypothetical protein